MSEISVISNQYNTMVATSDRINNSVIAFKKKSLLQDHQNRSQYPKLSVSGEELEAAKDTLLAFLRSVRSLLKGEQVQSDFIPSLIVNDYKRKLVGTVYLEEDLDDMLARLQNGQAVDENAIAVLDNLLSLLDKERNALFRKLRRARG
jgi:hypothetical protein